MEWEKPKPSDGLLTLRARPGITTGTRLSTSQLRCSHVPVAMQPMPSPLNAFVITEKKLWFHLLPVYSILSSSNCKISSNLCQHLNFSRKGNIEFHYTQLANCCHGHSDMLNIRRSDARRGKPNALAICV